MEGIVLKLSVQGDKRILLTVVGIAVCIMYLTGTIGMVGGLHVGTAKLSERVKQGPVLVYRTSLNESLIPASIADELTGEFIAYRLSEVDVFANGSLLLRTYALSIFNVSQDGGVSELLPEAMGGGTENTSMLGSSVIEVISEAGIALGSGADLTLASGSTEVNVTYNGTYAKSIIPDDWIWVMDQMIQKLRPDMGGQYSFLLVPQDSTEDIELLASKGYVTARTAGFLRFFERGINQVEGNLWGVIMTSAVVITLLVYSIMSIEVQYKLEDIRILRFLGGSRRLVMAVFMLKSFFISLFGGVLGVALGVIVMNAITSFAPLLGYNTLVIPQTSWQSTALPFMVAIFFGIVGGLIPAYKASKLDMRRGDVDAA